MCSPTLHSFLADCSDYCISHKVTFPTHIVQSIYDVAHNYTLCNRGLCFLKRLLVCFFLTNMNSYYSIIQTHCTKARDNISCSPQLCVLLDCFNFFDYQFLLMCYTKKRMCSSRLCFLLDYSTYLITIRVASTVCLGSRNKYFFCFHCLLLPIGLARRYG